MKKHTKFIKSLTLSALAVGAIASAAPASALDYGEVPYNLQPTTDEYGPELMLVSMRPAEDKMTVRFENRDGRALKMVQFVVAISTDGKPIDPAMLEDGGYIVPLSYGAHMISAPVALRNWFRNGPEQEFTRTDMQYEHYLSEEGMSEGGGFLYLTGKFTENGFTVAHWVVEIDYRDCLLAPDMTECRAVVADNGSGVVNYVPFDDNGNDLSYQVREAKLTQQVTELTEKNERLAAELEDEKNKPAEVIEAVKEVPVEVVKEVIKEVPVERRVTEYVDRYVPTGVIDTGETKIKELEAEIARLKQEISEKEVTIEALRAGETEVPETLQRDDKTVYWWMIVLLSISLAGLLLWWFLPVRRKKQERE